jgi:transcriptional regulator with XRE-family HTH domain
MEKRMSRSDMDTLAGRLAWARDRTGLSLRDASDESKKAPTGRGVSHQSIRDYEEGAEPTGKALEALAWAYEVDLTWLLTGIGEPLPAAVGE